MLPSLQRPYARDGQGARVEHVQEVGTKQRFPALLVGVLERRTERSAHHVHERVQAAPPRVRRREQCLQRGPITHVADLQDDIRSEICTRGCE